jgi:hypothetical protein
MNLDLRKDLETIIQYIKCSNKSPYEDIFLRSLLISVATPTPCQKGLPIQYKTYVPGNGIPQPKISQLLIP